MRILLPAFAFACLAAPAFASSIEPLAGSSGSAGSVATIRCSDCPPLKEKPRSETYYVQPIEPGTQKVEIREENGERKIFRTEAWMGGSPVLFMNKAPQEATRTVQTRDEAGKAAEMHETVDAGAKTGALDAGVAGKAAMAGMATSREFDPAGFELRVN